MKKILCLMIVAVFILETLISCGHQNLIEETTDPSVTVTQEPAKIDSKTTVLPNHFEEGRHSGTTLKIYAAKFYNGSVIVQQCPLEEREGDVIDQSLRERDRLFESFFGVNLQYRLEDYDEGWVMRDKIANNVYADSNEFDLVFGSMFRMTGIHSNGWSHNLADIDMLDLEKNWWSQNARNAFTFNGNIYFSTGDITTRYFSAPVVMEANVGLLRNNGINIEDIYQLVDDQKWTIEELHKLIQGYGTDIDNDGIPEQTGLTQSGTGLHVLVYGCGGQFITRDEQGIPELNNSAGLIDIIDAVTAKFTTNGTLDVYYGVAPLERNLFFYGKALFATNTLCNLVDVSLHDFETTFLPMPKYNEEQANYYSNINPYISTGIFIPKTLPADQTNRVGYLADGLAAISKYTSSEEMYSRIIQYQKATSPKAREMLILCVENSQFELAEVFDWGMNVTISVNNAIQNNASAKSTLDAVKESVDRKIRSDILNMQLGT